MIINLPTEFPVTHLSKFDFGSAEASEDDLLINCACRLRAINEFLIGHKNIILGERGAGKSALFRMIRERSLSFENKAGKKQLLIPIEDQLQYSMLAEKITSHMPETGVNIDLKYRFVWELLILSRIGNLLQEEFPEDQKAKEIFKEINDALGIGSTKTTFLQMLVSHKKSIGVKIENIHLGIFTPNFYATMEPSANAASDSNVAEIDVDLLKKRIAAFLKHQNAVLIILFDKLDEFVIQEEYQEQKHIIQGLLHCQRGYGNIPEIKLKLFLRTDLFKRLDFQAIGYDKVISKTVELNWTAEEMREFVAKRVFYNLVTAFDLSGLQFTFDHEKLYLSQRSLGVMDGDDDQEKRENDFLLPLKKIYWQFLSFLERSSQDARDARKTNFNDEVNRQIITTIFPRLPNHLTVSGVVKTIDLFEYLASHFSLGTSNTTPRIVLMFLQKCLDQTRDYFSKNPDTRLVLLDTNNEYPLILRDCMLRAYEELQNQIWETFANVDARWKLAVHHLQQHRDSLSGIKVSYSEMKRLIEGDFLDEKELQQFLAFLSHIGLLACYGGQSNYPKRHYELPILFQGVT